MIPITFVMNWVVGFCNLDHVLHPCLQLIRENALVWWWLEHLYHHSDKLMVLNFVLLRFFWVLSEVECFSVVTYNAFLHFHLCNFNEAFVEPSIHSESSTINNLIHWLLRWLCTARSVITDSQAVPLVFYTTLKLGPLSKTIWSGLLLLGINHLSDRNNCSSVISSACSK